MISTEIPFYQISRAIFQDKTNALVDTIRLYEKGVSSFEGSDRTMLEKHLIKTMCTDIMMELLRFVCQEHQVDIDQTKELSDRTKETDLIRIQLEVDGNKQKAA